MYQMLAIGSLVAVLAVLLVVKLRKPKRQKRWMPDIRRVV